MAGTMAGTGFLAESITSNFIFTAKIPLLMKATSNDERPTQGYDLQEITNISKSSLPNCKSLLNFLLGRLEKKSPFIKFKVLNLMTYLAINGHSEFRSALRHNSEMVKKLTSFRGEVDPIHGDGLNINVQEAAKKLELLLFDINNPEVEVICQSMIAPNQSGKKMEGFGNTITPPIKKDQSLSDVLKKVKETIPELMTSNLKKPPSEAPSGFQPLNTMQYTPVKFSFEDDHDQTRHRSVVDLKNDEAGLHIHKAGEGNMIGDSHFYERKIVDDITAEGGARSTPSKEILKAFLNKLLLLDFHVILNLLDEKLKEPSSSVQLKSLSVIEYLLKCDLPDVFSSVNEHCGYINTLKTSNEPVIQAKANKVSLTISSAMRLKSPPSYEIAKQLPSVRTNNDNSKMDSTEVDSLFSGMNFSNSSDDVTPRQTALIPDLLEETTVDTVQKTGEYPVPISETPRDIFDPLLTFETLGDNTVNTQSMIVHPEQLNTNTHNAQVRPRTTPQKSSNNDTNHELLLSGNCQLNVGNIDFISSVQPALPAEQGTIRNLVPNTNTTAATAGSGQRRQFPKDMKSEEDGFAFLRKSSKKGAFSFVDDEMAASKVKQK